MTDQATGKLAVFDCDGTLVDSQFAIHACMRDAFLGANISPPDVSAVRRVVGLPLKTAIVVLLDGIDASSDDLAARYSHAWQEFRKTDTLHEPMFDGVREVIVELSKDGWKLGVATGKSSRGLDATLGHHDLAGYFSTLQTSDRAKGKPDPEMLELAMYEADVVRQKTVMIGDTTFDVEMANAAGVCAIGVAWGYHTEDELWAAGAYDVVVDMQQLKRAVDAFGERSE